MNNKKYKDYFKDLKFDNSDDITISLEQLEQLFFYEMDPFSDAIEIYKSNLLYILMDIISKELMRLTRLQREIILKYFFDQKSERVIAKELNIKHQNVHKYKLSALKILKSRLQANPYFVILYKKFKEEDPSIKLLVDISNFLDSKNGMA